jgi:hypothetical protein
MKTQSRGRRNTMTELVDKRKMLNEKGIVLVVVMFLIAVLSLIALSAGRSITTDTAVAGNHLTSIQALYMAEAGLERAKNEAARRYLGGSWNDFNTILTGGLALGTGTVGFHGGTFAVQVLNDIGDANPLVDTNRSITFQSVGVYGTSKATVRSTIRMNQLMNLPGAVNLVGGDITEFKSTNSLTIDGRDYNLTDADRAPHGSCAQQYAISVGDVPSVSQSITNITNTLDSKQYDDVIGKDGSETKPSIGEGTTVNKINLRDFVDGIRYAADNTLTDPTDLNGSTSGSDNCLTTSSSGIVCLGSVSHPKVTYIKATTDTALEITGNISGVGLLIVDGENLTFKGNVNWKGVVVVLGSNVSFTDDGGGKEADIRGGLLVGEYGATKDGVDLKVNGNVKITYSCEAINLVNTALQANHKYSVLSWQRVYQ